VATLGITPDEVTWTSDHFDMLLAKGEELIRRGFGYVDKTDAETMKEQRTAGIPSPDRENSLEENLRLWNEMVKGSEEGLVCCVRAKGQVEDPLKPGVILSCDMQNNNKCMRDPMMFRCKPGLRHHRLGDRWNKAIFPGYDFACPIVDSVEGVTHAMRTLEYQDREVQYKWVCGALGIRCPYMYGFSRLNFTNTCLSKRKLTQFVNKKITHGWDDPRMPTVRGILRKGMTVQGLREYIYQQGASRNESLQEWDKIWALNKQLIDPVVPRYTAILRDAHCNLTAEAGEGVPTGVELKMRNLHPKDAAMDLERVKVLAEAGLPNTGLGSAAIRFSKSMLLETFDANSFELNEEITLMGWGNAIVRKLDKAKNGDVTEVGVELNLNGDFRKTKKKVTWLAALNDLVPLTLVDMEHLITCPKILEGMDCLDHINPDSWKETHALGDQNMRLIKKGDIIQLNRKGYYCCDKPFVSEASPMVLFHIPDGRITKAKKATGARS